MIFVLVCWRGVGGTAGCDDFRARVLHSVVLEDTAALPHTLALGLERGVFVCVVRSLEMRTTPLFSTLLPSMFFVTSPSYQKRCVPCFS